MIVRSILLLTLLCHLVFSPSLHAQDINYAITGISPELLANAHTIVRYEHIDFKVKSGTESIAYRGVVVGDVWLLGGQSNMEDVLESIYHGDTEVASANFPNIRLMTVPSKATPKPQPDIQRINEYNSWTRRHELKGHWIPCERSSHQSPTWIHVAMLNNVVAHGRLCESGILKFCKAKFPVHVRTMLHENVYLDSLL